MTIQALLSERMRQFFERDTAFPYTEEIKKFQFYSIHSILGPFSMSYEQILEGITDEKNDYGIDGIYCFSSGTLMENQEDLDIITSDSAITVKLIQVASERGFGQTTMLKIRNGVETIFNFDTPLKGNPRFTNRAHLVREVLRKWAASSNKHTPRIEILYVSNGDSGQVHSDVQAIETKMHAFLESLGMRNPTIKYIGPKKLFQLADSDEYNGTLIFSKVLEYIDKKNPNIIGYIGTVKVGDFLRLIQDEYGNVRPKYFEYNVRDYYGTSKFVNENIMVTLRSEKRRNFWCMNNGITIICKKARKLAEDITLTNFQVVNGCQTAHVMNDCKDYLNDDDSCQVVVRIVETEDDAVTTDIIDATNSQTSVQTTALRSNEDIQKHIEEYFASFTKFPLYYERRINYYRRRGKPSSKIVSVLRLFQVMYSTFKKKPSLSRSNPTRTFDEHYDEVFDEGYDYDSYLLSYLLYFQLYQISRELELTTAVIRELEVRKYGIFHILRTAFALILKSDSEINLKSRHNAVRVQKDLIISTIFNTKILRQIYTDACAILMNAVEEYLQNNPSVTITNILKKDEFDTEYLTPAVRRSI